MANLFIKKVTNDHNINQYLLKTIYYVVDILFVFLLII